MYLGINKFITSVRKDSQDDFSVILDGAEHLDMLVLQFRDAAKARNNYSKHLKKQMHTQKWLDKEDLLKENLISASAQLLVYFNLAHTFQVSFFKTIYRSFMLKETEAILRSQEAPDAYVTLLEHFSVLDSTDREQYMLFNRLRNIFFHHTLESIMQHLEPEFTNDAIELIHQIGSNNKMLFSYVKNEIRQIAKFDIRNKQNLKENND